MATPLDDLAHVIQLSVAPVFLLTSVGTILAVLSSRLGRIVDRMRVLGDRLGEASVEKKAAMQIELATLRRRRHLVNTAITFGTITALFVCLLIVVAFIGYIVQLPMTLFVALLFILAMLSFIVALIWFLREVLMAARAVHIETARAGA